MTHGQDQPSEYIACRVSEDCKARVYFDGVMTQEGIRKLIAFLELSADIYPKKDSLKHMHHRALADED